MATPTKPATLDEAKMQRVVTDADLAFWQVVADAYPEAEYGDLSPLMTLRIDTAMKDAVREWVMNNAIAQAPETTEDAGACAMCGAPISSYSGGGFEHTEALGLDTAARPFDHEAVVVVKGDVPDPREGGTEGDAFKVWVSIERIGDDGETYEDEDPASVGTFDTQAEAEAFARTIGWTPFNES